MRGSGLFWLAAGATRPVETVGGIAGPSYQGAGNYYGYIAWDMEFAWHS